MDTIKNYLETMFANLPSTPEVWKAKKELLSMMEDKYNELIAEGLSDNEAVARVISEFGNLDELADDLGIKDACENKPEKEVKMISIEQVKAFLDVSAKRSLFVALGVLLCIVSVVFPIVFNVIGVSNLGVAGLFLSIGAGVGLFIYSESIMKEWKYLEKEKCGVNYETANYIKEREGQIRQATTVHRIVGVLLCALCWVPAMLLSDGNLAFLRKLLTTGTMHLRGDVAGDAGGALLFIMVGVGVFYIVYSSLLRERFNRFIKPNDDNTISGTYTENHAKMEYTNPVVKVIMSVYWPVIACIYFIFSFVTFKWGITWIIWPIAAIINVILSYVFKKKPVDENK